MVVMSSAPDLTWLQPGDPFPDPRRAWTAGSPAPGLLAAGSELTPERLLQAYRHGIFPWFSQGQPVLWYCTHPRMVLRPSQYLLHDNLRKRIRRLLREDRLQVRFDDDFAQVIGHCARASREGQSGTWIGADMIEAYVALHRLGHAQAVTAWVDGQLAGGLYGVTIGRMVFGESMFTLRPDGSKIALSALIAWARHHEIPMIDCQQETAHLRFMGARPIERDEFLQDVATLVKMPAPEWAFSPTFWQHLWPQTT
jgi:leucyl/phenylalanyl-tRNA--protein transferase